MQARPSARAVSSCNKNFLRASSLPSEVHRSQFGRAVRVTGRSARRRVVTVGGAGPNLALSHRGIDADELDDDCNRLDFSDTDFEGGVNFIAGARRRNGMFLEMKAGLRCLERPAAGRRQLLTSSASRTGTAAASSGGSKLSAEVSATHLVSCRPRGHRTSYNEIRAFIHRRARGPIGRWLHVRIGSTLWRTWCSPGLNWTRPDEHNQGPDGTAAVLELLRVPTSFPIIAQPGCPRARTGSPGLTRRIFCARLCDRYRTAL